MKRKKLICALMIASLTAVIPPLSAGAEGTSTSSGTVAFEEKTITPPVDPENPVEPQEPPEVPGTGQEGNFTLDVVPHPYFGTYPVPTLNVTYLSKIVAGIGDQTGGATAQTFIQVSDARPSENNGWHVSVKANPFINTEDTGNQINGARMIFEEGRVNGPNEDAPTAYQVTLNCIDGSNQEKIFVAEEGYGIGTWVSRLYPTNWSTWAVGDDNPMIKLFIPANSGVVEGQTYVSVLTWTLSDAP